jgi:hypothetical protein
MASCRPSLPSHDGAPHDGARLDLGAFEQDAPFYDGPLSHPAPHPREDRPPIVAGSRSRSRGHRDGGRSFTFLPTCTDGPRRVVEVSPALRAGEDVVGGARVAARRPDVPPIRARDVAPGASRAWSSGKISRSMETSRLGGIRSRPRLEHVDRRVHQVGRNLVGGGFLENSVHTISWSTSTRP